MTLKSQTPDLTITPWFTIGSHIRKTLSQDQLNRRRPKGSCEPFFTAIMVVFKILCRFAIS